MTWLENIERAEKEGTFSDEDVNQAGNWMYCAIGEKYHPIENSETYVRDSIIKKYNVDEFYYKFSDYNSINSINELLRLGKDFYIAVSENRIVAAKRIYLEIQEASKRLEKKSVD